MYVDSRGKLRSDWDVDVHTPHAEMQRIYNENSVSPKTFRIWVGLFLLIMIVPMVYLYLFG